MIPLARAAFVPFVLIAAAFAEEKAEALPKDSPFRDRRQPAAAVAAASETIEFAGVSAFPKRTDLIFYDKTTKKNHWIAEGETKEGITVLKYDARREQVVVKINGVEKNLQLRKGGSPTNQPAGVPAMPVGFNTPQPAVMPQTLPAAAPTPIAQMAPAPAPATPAIQPAANKPEGPITPETQQKQETEARMLVSDLLEIGMAQRKAYEEAQRKASSGEATPPAAAAAQAPAPTPDKPNGN